jgi:phosphoribosyl 1,2-cyclic phosphate phosphodiesterase
MRITVLGCGSSVGVPVLGSGWGRCDPTDPRNRRRRCSILVENDGFVLLVDTSPDLREQLLDAGVTRIDAVLFTHGHADHRRRGDAGRIASAFQLSFSQG